MESVIFWHHPMSADRATALANLHHQTFSESGCRSCKGPCCRDCAEEVGYLRHTWAATAEIRRLKAEYAFDEVDGFRGPTGCRLPLHLRSPTCAAFYCGSSPDGFPGVSTPAHRLPEPQRLLAIRRANRLKRAFEEE